MAELKDTDPMPFGKHKGTPMQDVPADYLHWLWTTNPARNTPIMRYIERNLSALKQEYPDGIW